MGERPAEAPAGGPPSLREALSDPATYPGHPPVTMHETHASWVFVAGERAYKVKKPVALGFLDYSSLTRRRRACAEEVRVNRALAPDVYLGVRAIVRSGPHLRLAPESAPGALEYAVEMRTFDEADTLAGLIGAQALEPEHVAAAARLLAEFHRRAPVTREWGPERVLERCSVNLAELEQSNPPRTWRVDAAAGFARAFVHAHAEPLRLRSREGFARDGHGDLRCEHVLVRPQLRVVDRIEFDPQLRRIDVACDLAFLAMDLEARGARWAASELFTAYERDGLDCGVPALRSFYATHWALVRAKVALIAGVEDPARLHEAEGLWLLAARLRWRARGPLLVVICGPAATGKSSLAAALSSRAEIAVHASDAVRKRLAGVDPHRRARPEHYSADFTHATYVQLALDATRSLRKDGKAIVDATCRTREDRAALLAGLPDVTRLFVRCQAPLELARERAERRLDDERRLSDATPQTVEQHFREFEELEEIAPGEVLRMDTTQAIEAQLAGLELELDARGTW